MQDVFKNALYHKEPTVLGRRLLPLSLAHIYALMAIDSPYTDGGPKSLIDLSVAVMICSRTWEEGQEFFRQSNLLRVCKAWGKTCGKMKFGEEQSKFIRYLDEYTQFPDRLQDVGATPCRHPWPLLVVQTILGKVTESRAWNMPLPLAVSYWSAEAELNGDETLKGDSFDADLAAQTAHREKQRREYMAKKAGK